ncbi:MAG: molybdopterin-dependent oxidoreductase [Vicinamibacterales bacterium]
MRLSRRAFVRAASAAAVAGALDRWLGAQALRPVDGGRLLRTMPLGRFDGRPAPPMHQLLGAGLDARQFTDLSVLAPDRLVTPTEHFYIRTAHPPLPAIDGWRLALGGRVEREQELGLRTLQEQAIDIGIRLMECAGNSDPANFGLLSAAHWDGVPMAAVLDRVRPQAPSGRLRVSGLDDEQRPSVTSNPGASWIFTRDELERRGAFLATAMNGAPLTPDHGAPIRLVVPNYYGCACIKWVTRIDWVADDEPATTQMLEFSSRTHQAGIPRRARDYAPPVIELAAAPVRVEQWQVGDRLSYRVVGVRWGGESRVAPLTIRFRSGERPMPVTDVPDTDNPATWSLWSHEWTPDAPGRYQIALGVSDRSVPARRLELYFYTRAVEIDRV